jgi:hypothetical protein
MLTGSPPKFHGTRDILHTFTRYTLAPHRRRQVTIDHQPLAGVTPEMLLDWFTHLGGTILYGDVVTDRYLAWHPLDHIRWELARPAPKGGAGEGARFHIDDFEKQLAKRVKKEVAKSERLRQE